MVQMAEKLTEHPILLYLIFIMPIVLLALGVIFNASVILLIIAASLMGVALILFFLPIESDTIAQ
jgi:uncharacterized MnhB-related membrane protein